jgi:hypothetical protein
MEFLKKLYKNGLVTIIQIFLILKMILAMQGRILCKELNKDSIDEDLRTKGIYDIGSDIYRCNGLK